MIIFYISKILYSRREFHRISESSQYKQAFHDLKRGETLYRGGKLLIILSLRMPGSKILHFTASQPESRPK